MNADHDSRRKDARARAGRWQALLLPLGMIALACAVWAGLSRIGASLLPVAPAPAIAAHGALAVFGFFGVTVALERAVALRRNWSLVAPVLGVVAAAVLVSGGEELVAGALWALAGIVSTAAAVALHLRSPSLANLYLCASFSVASAGALAWAAGAPLAVAMPLWASFLVLAIVGERIQFAQLERRLFTRIAGPSGLLALLAAMVLVALEPQVGMRAAGAVFVALGTWLVAVDAARHSRRAGLVRYVGVGLACGYAWLLVTGGLWLMAAPQTPGLVHDAAVHAVFQGFALGMIFAHAPMIFPALTGVRMPFRPIYYVPLGVLHGGLALRVGGGLAGSAPLAHAGAALTAVALAGFLAALGTSALLARKGGPSSGRGGASAVRPAGEGGQRAEARPLTTAAR